MDAYYVCARCAHTYAAPERPDRCERCRQHGSWLICAGRDPDRAERLSEQVLARRRRRRRGRELPR
jgi:hypothetical protein